MIGSLCSGLVTARALVVATGVGAAGEGAVAAEADGNLAGLGLAAGQVSRVGLGRYGNGNSRGREVRESKNEAHDSDVLGVKRLVGMCCVSVRLKKCRGVVE
ncbi:hypothetical protein F4780DRAFT_742881 [Xylariomycetidae sp. FL0641]|nr:hypothetical protein F4780DRAFT_742881 [Xylariomycetidae sp. FL0641]